MDEGDGASGTTRPTVRWPDEEAVADAAASPFAEGALVPGERRSLAAGIAVTPWPVVGLLVLRGERERVADAFGSVLGVAPPAALASVAFALGDGEDGAAANARDAAPADAESAPARRSRLRWTGPDEWLLSCPIGRAASLERALRAAGVAAVTEVSSAMLGFDLEGPRVEALLARSTPCDVHPRVFPPGKVVGTVFAKTPVTLARLELERVELVARRSFADYLARWLLRAAAGSGR